MGSWEAGWTFGRLGWLLGGWVSFWEVGSAFERLGGLLAGLLTCWF